MDKINGYVLTWIKEQDDPWVHIREVKDFKHRPKPRFVAGIRLMTACLFVAFNFSVASQNPIGTNAETHALVAPVTTVATVATVATLASTNAAVIEPVDATAMKFVHTCAGCHTYGGGKLTGPDLVVAAAWPKPDLKANIKRMEEKAGPLPDDMIEQLALFLKDPKVRERIKTAEAVIALKYAAKLDPGSITIGKELYSGVRPFKNRGMACAGCHSVAGQLDMLGPDLKGVHAKMGETALISAIQKANFKVMDAAFKNHPVTPQEALHLAKYFGTLKADSQPQRAGFPVLGAGVALAAVSLAAITFLYRRRANGQSLPLQRRRN